MSTTKSIHTVITKTLDTVNISLKLQYAEINAKVYIINSTIQTVHYHLKTFMMYTTSSMALTWVVFYSKLIIYN